MRMVITFIMGSTDAVRHSIVKCRNNQSKTQRERLLLNQLLRRRQNQRKQHNRPPWNQSVVANMGRSDSEAKNMVHPRPHPHRKLLP